MDGWEPREVHEHFDAGGVPCRAADAFTTVVTREPEWDESDRARALALHRYETDLCPCGCGQPTAEATEKDRVFRIQTHVCYARRALDRFQKQQTAKAEAEKRPDGWDDGWTYYIDDSFVHEQQGGVKRGN